MPTSLEYTPPWNSKAISFTMYKMHNEITNDALVSKLKLLKGNIPNRNVGWLAESPLLKIYNDYSKISCFVYMLFRKNTNVSTLYGDDYWQTDPIGCVFDFKNKLIIAMTTSESKLAQLEKNAFIPIQPLTPYTKRKYDAEFPFWLSYIYDKKGGEITNNVYVKDFFAISSGREQSNISDSVSSNTKCTDQIESRLILGINGTARAASFKIIANGESYSLLLYEDGRIKVKEPKKLEKLEDKVAYAEEIDDVLGKIYTKYQGSQTEWAAVRAGYKKDLLVSVVEEISNFTEE